MKLAKHIILTVGIMLGFGLAVVPSTVSALDICPPGVSSDSPLCKKDDTFGGFIKIIVDTLLFVLAAVSVITIIIGGIRYTTSHGDPKAVQVAKDTVLYSVVGLVVAILAYAIVDFVAKQFS